MRPSGITERDSGAQIGIVKTHRARKAKDPFSRIELSTYDDQRESAFRLLKLLSEWHLISWSSWRTLIAARGIVFASDATLDDNILTRIQIQRPKD